MRRKTPVMLHAYRLLSGEGLQLPDSLWEWHEPWIAHLCWHARTFRRQVVQRYFLSWQELAEANTQLWAISYAPWPCYAPWPTWHGWFIEYRELLVVTRELSEASHSP